jgi:flavin-dependent dehydrogenase
MAYLATMTDSGKRRDRSAAEDWEVIVVGGGPAGSTAACHLAQSGHRVVLFERDEFPRFHIGESLLASANDVLSAIGADQLVRNEKFPQKWGATFLPADGSVERYLDFGMAPGVGTPQTWQVPRARFDHLLLQHAAASGVTVHEKHRVVEVTFEPDGVTATVQDADGARREIRARAIIDAAGRSALLSRKFELRYGEPSLDNIAIFSHFSGVPRQEGRRCGDIRIIARHDMGWFWLIPISGELMSVGVVVPTTLIRSEAGLDHEAFLQRAIDETPAVARLLANARREWPVRVEKDFSFGSRAYAGNRWLLAGDAGSFLDPVFSTGVAIALESGLEAGRVMAAALTANDFSQHRFDTYSRRQRQRYESFKRFVVGFYTPEFRDLFFSESPPPRMFRALVTIFAGYWRPAITTRAWIRLFFLLVRLQRIFPLVPHVAVRGMPAS